MLPLQVLRLSPPQLCLVSSVSPLLHPGVSSVSHLWLCREFHGCVLSRPLPVGHVLNSHVLLQPYYAGNIRVTHTALSHCWRRCSSIMFCTAQHWGFQFLLLDVLVCLLCYALSIFRTAVGLLRLCRVCREAIRAHTAHPLGSPQPLRHLDIECPTHIQTLAPLLPYICLFCFKVWTNVVLSEKNSFVLNSRSWKVWAVC